MKTKRPPFRFDTDSRVSLGRLCWQFGEVLKLTARVFGAPLDSEILPNRRGRAGAGKVIIQDVRIRQIAISALDSVDYKRRVSALLRGRAEWASWNVREWQIALCRACTPRLVRRFCRAIASPDFPHRWLSWPNLRCPGNGWPLCDDESNAQRLSETSQTWFARKTPAPSFPPRRGVSAGSQVFAAEVAAVRFVAMSGRPKGNLGQRRNESQRRAVGVPWA